MTRDAVTTAVHQPQTVRAALYFVVDGHRRALAKMAATAFSGGIAEALFLITVTRAAFAITGDSDRVGVVAAWYLSIPDALLVAFALVLLRIGLSAYAAWLSAQLSTDVVAAVRRQLAGAFLEASWKSQQRFRAGSLQELLTSYAGQASAMTTSVNQGVVAGANLFALSGVAVAVDPLGAVVLVVSVGGLALLLRPLRRAIRGRADAMVRAGMEFATSVNEVSEIGLELHVFHVQQPAKAHVGGLIESVRERTRRLQFAGGLTTPLYTGLAYFALLAALSVVALSDSASLTSLGAAMLVMLRSLSYGQALQVAYSNVSSTTPAIEQLREQIEILERGRRLDGHQPVGEVGRITARAVFFSYRPGEQLLSDISFEIEPGEIIGIVGPSGGGKSTLVQLLLGLREPDQGQILFDERDLAKLSRAELARKITFVPQSPHLIAGTIAENIRFWRSGVTQPMIEEACRSAYLHDEVTAFPEGYEREVGEHGGHLSGGQQQRLCIARALVEDPDVLIMDEPTSALDVRSEHLIRTTLAALRGRVTVVVIAHRLSTLDICDRIMVIQDGRLIGFDTPTELERSNAFYREALTLSGLR